MGIYGEVERKNSARPALPGHQHLPKDPNEGLRTGLRLSHVGGMEQKEAIQKIREQINQIAAHVTAMHPLVPGLADPPTQGELLKALYELTKSVEAAKKHLLKLEKRDDSAVL
jgi:hypothetical protein